MAISNSEKKSLRQLGHSLKPVVTVGDKGLSDNVLDELKRALMECGRKLGTHVRKGKKLANEFKKRNYITMYIPHVVDALKDILELEDKEVEQATGKLTDVLERSRKL